MIRKESNRLIVRILEFPQLWGNRPDAEGTTVLEAECRLRTFAGAVLSASQSLFERYGEEGYRERWYEHEFPLDKQEKLRQLLHHRAS